ncbi:MAG: iron ABC transporter permease [Bacteroidota bacterium]
MRNRTRIIAILLFLSFVFIFLLSLQTGSADYTWQDIVDQLFDPQHPDRFILIELRLPRTMLSLLAGGVLTLSGFYMQALIKNPLADPYIMGLTAGAGFGVNIVILGIVPIATYTIWTYPTFAALGAMGTLLLVVGLGFRALLEDNSKLLIAGVAVSAIFTAATGVMIYLLANNDQLRQLIFWSFGSFGKATWDAVAVTALMLGVGLLFGQLNHRKLDVMSLGDDQALSLGLEVRKFKYGLLFWTSLIVGGTVAFTGPIGFVGMMIPHFSRSLFGGLHQPNIWLGTLLGAVYLMTCDVLSRWILSPGGLPIGIITAILGVPFFLYLLFGKNSHL